MEKGKLSLRTRLMFCLYDKIKQAKGKIKREDFVNDVTEELKDEYKGNTKTLINYHLNRFIEAGFVGIEFSDGTEYLYLTEDFPVLGIVENLTSGYKLAKFVPAKICLISLIFSLLIFFHALSLGQFIPFIYSLLFLIITAINYLSYIVITVIEKPSKHVKSDT